MDKSKQLENELAAAAVKAGILPLAKNINVKIVGFIAGVNLDGEAVAVFGLKEDNKPTNIIVTNLGDVDIAAQQLKDSDFRDNFANLMAGKLEEE